MKDLTVKKCKKFSTTIDNIASDKSISHRCAIFSLLSNKPSIIKNFLRGEDTINSLKIIQKLGAKIEDDGKVIKITPPITLNEPDDILDCGNAGTGMRLYAGFLAGISGSFVLTGDKYLRNRPMNRVTKPLKEIGAKIDGREDGNKAPLHIRGAKLNSFKYHSQIDSAQVKSALILAGIQGKKKSFYKENLLSRDHTERMLNGMGANIITNKDGYIEISPLDKPLKPLNIAIPSDPSSGFFFAVATAIIPNSKVILKNVTLNPTRIEAYKVLKKMGAIINFIEKENIYEPIGDILIEYAPLKSVVVDKNIAWLIDELPALSIAFATAKGVSRVKNAKELRVKESNRIKTVVDNLNLCGIKTNEFEDGYEVVGGELKSAIVNSFGDHRIAMSFAIAGLKTDMKIKDVECIDTSFPNFIELLKRLNWKLD